MNELQSCSSSCITGSPKNNVSQPFCFNILGLFRMFWFAIVQLTSQITRIQRNDCLSQFLWRDNSQQCLEITREQKTGEQRFAPFFPLRTPFIIILFLVPTPVWEVKGRLYNYDPCHPTVHLPFEIARYSKRRASAMSMMLVHGYVRALQMWPYLPKWGAWVLSEIMIFCSIVQSIEFSLTWCKPYQNRSTGFEIMTM